MILTRLLEPALCRISPEARREAAAWITVVSLLGFIACCFLVVAVEFALWVTLELSWLALTFTGIDIFVSSDVRVQQEGST